MSNIFESLINRGVPLSLAAEAEDASLRTNPHATIQKLISFLFWLGVIAITEFAIIVGLLVALIV